MNHRQAMSAVHYRFSFVLIKLLIVALCILLAPRTAASVDLIDENGIGANPHHLHQVARAGGLVGIARVDAGVLLNRRLPEMAGRRAGFGIFKPRA